MVLRLSHLVMELSVLENKEVGCSIRGISFNKHNRAHIVRAAQEGIVFSFCYGMEIMQQMGMDIKNIHAGKANMFLSPLFRDTLAGVSGATRQMVVQVQLRVLVLVPVSIRIIMRLLLH